MAKVGDIVFYRFRAVGGGAPIIRPAIICAMNGDKAVLSIFGLSGQGAALKPDVPEGNGDNTWSATPPE
jgi:hypothetical protein